MRTEIGAASYFKYVDLVDSKLHTFLLCSTIDVGQKALAYSVFNYLELLYCRYFLFKKYTSHK